MAFWGQYSLAQLQKTMKGPSLVRSKNRYHTFTTPGQLNYNCLEERREKNSKRETKSLRETQRDKMKELTPSGWIEVLIGIFVFASTVGQLASQTPPIKCWKKADSAKIQDVNVMEAAFDPKNWKTDCPTNEKCLQYYSPASKASETGKLEVAVECGLDCLGSRTAAARIGATYQCFSCGASDGTGCKTFATDVKVNYLKECYEYNGPKVSADLLTVKQLLCFDKCVFVEETTNVTVGCDANISSASKADCTGSKADCAEKIGGSRCWKDSNAQVVESVADITDAYTRSKWSVVCSGAKKCLQYYPEATNTKGKVQVVFECGTSCGDANARMTKAGFTCTECETGKRAHGCKDKISEVKTDKPCCSYNGPKGKATDIKKIYCLDSCQYAESDGGKMLTVGCTDDIKSAGVTLTNCPADDATCEKMIKGPSSGPDSGSGSGGLNTITTAAPKKNSNKLTSSPICLIVSMAIAASQYMQKF